MSKFIHHPVFSAVMTLTVGLQWFRLGTLVDSGWSGLLVFNLAIAVIATGAVIGYHYSSRKVAFFQGKVQGIDTAFRRWHV